MRFNLPWRRKAERVLALQGGIDLCDILIDELVKMGDDKKHSAGKRSGFRHAQKLVRGSKLTLIGGQQQLADAPRWFQFWKRSAAK